MAAILRKSKQQLARVGNLLPRAWYYILTESLAMPRSHIQRLLNALASNIGRESAKQELKWIQQTGRTDLEAMLRRRTMGEPLQYILGESQPAVAII